MSNTLTHTNPLIIFHADCLDGFTAAAVAKAVYPKADMFPAKYGQPNPCVRGRTVFILDFSYPRAVLEQMHLEARELWVLDHHQTAERDLEGLPYCLFDMKRSGAAITWDYFRPGQPRPKLVDYVQDIDFWKFELPHSKEIMAALMSYPKNLETWHFLANQMDSQFESIVSQGQAIKRYQDTETAFLIKYAREVELSGYKVLAVNTASLRSEVANKIAENRPFGIAWSQKDDGRYVYSLRVSLTSPGVPDINVAKIAEQFGGGGHRASASFITDTLIF